MTRHLCISVTLLDGLFHGKRDAGEAEWPPSPLRLFQALLAGARTGCRTREWSDAKADAFRWLERRQPPEIVAPLGRPAPSYSLYVPNNNSDKTFNRQDRLTTKVARPHRTAGGRTCHYLWKMDDDMAEHSPAAEALRREARRILALGWGIDQAVGDGLLLTPAEAAALPGLRWTPWESAGPSGAVPLRIPRPGTLDDLERVHASFLASVSRDGYRPKRKPSVFATAAYARPLTLPGRPSAGFDLHDRRGDRRAFAQTDAVAVAAMVRHVACEAAKRDSHEFPGRSELYVAGHVGDAQESPPRFSYLPLPTVGHPHADGLIRRVLIAEPYGTPGDHARWARRRLRHSELTDTTGQARCVLAPAEGTDNVAACYTRPARSWSSVTPVVLPGFDDGRHYKAQRLFFKATGQAGLPVEAIAEMVLRKAPFWPGSQHPRRYRRPDYLRDLPAWHVHLRFHEPIPGPLAIGAGRHCGLGLFAAEKGD